MSPITPAGAETPPIPAAEMQHVEDDQEDEEFQMQLHSVDKEARTAGILKAKEMVAQLLRAVVTSLR